MTDRALRRYTKAEVDAALDQVEHGHLTSHAVLVLAGEVQALRLQYRSVLRCTVHNCRMFVATGGHGFTCWRCLEGARLESAVVELTAQLAAATACPSGSLVPDADGRMSCRYRPHKQAQVSALQADNDSLRNQLAQLRVEFHFLLEGCEHAFANGGEHA